MGQPLWVDMATQISGDNKLGSIGWKITDGNQPCRRRIETVFRIEVLR